MIDIILKQAIFLSALFAPQSPKPKEDPPLQPTPLEKTSQKSFNKQIVPFIVLDPFQPGFGVSLRIEKLGHTIEFSPWHSPTTYGYFGSSEYDAFACSYFYKYINKYHIHPYIGISYNLQKKHSHYKNFLLPLLGIEYCKFEKTPSLYVFLDAPITPRIGVGCNF